MEFEVEEDAAAALENMEGSELFGKVLRCNYAKAMVKLTPGKAVWNDEEWIKSQLAQEEEGQEEEEKVAREVTLLPSREVDEEDDQQ